MAAWQPHPDATLEAALAHAPPRELARVLREPRIAGDPYARLRLLDRLHRLLPDNPELEMAWIQSMLMANRPEPVWQITRHWPLHAAAEHRGSQLLAAQVAQVMGESEEARARYVNLLERFPEDVDAWQKYIDFEQPERLPAAPPSSLARLYDSATSSYVCEKAAFAMAAFRHRDAPREAFQLAVEAHGLKRQRIGRWDRDATRQRMEKDLLWKALAPGETTMPRPLFIVGLPRSGTTLLSSILGSHPQIANAGEQNLVAALAAGPCSRPGQGDRRMQAFVRSWYAAAVGDLAGDASVIVDKLPANAEHCGLILSMFPDALVVHLERDRKDCAASIHMHDFDFGCLWGSSPSDLSCYADMIGRQMEHWRATAGERVRHMRFEDLLADPAGAILPLLESAGLEWKEEMLSFWQRRQSVATFSERQVRQPVGASGAGTWRRYLPEAADWFDTVGGQQ